MLIKSEGFHKDFWLTCTICFIFFMVYDVFETGLPLYIKDLGLKAGFYGAVLSFSNFLRLLAALPAERLLSLLFCL